MYSYSLCDNLSLAPHTFSVDRGYDESSPYIFIMCVSRWFYSHTRRVSISDQTGLYEDDGKGFF